MLTVNARSFPRAGLLGNPSDGYFGKTLSFAFADYCVDLKLTESAKMRFVPGEVDDAMFDSPRHLVRDLRLYGYYGGIRMLKAVAKLFFEYCEEHGVAIPERNFTAEYRTNIPRLVGLSGSSAICSAMLKALCRFYDVPIVNTALNPQPATRNFLPLDYTPTICLEAEKCELGINCGFQDRVIQMYGGLVFMDFRRDYVEANNKGIYEELDPAILQGGDKLRSEAEEGNGIPFEKVKARGEIERGEIAAGLREQRTDKPHAHPHLNVYVAFDPNRAEESGQAHKRVKRLFEEKKPDILSAMSEFADIAQQGRDLIVAAANSSHLSARIAELVNANFDLRDKIFNVAEENRRMVMTARSAGASAKFAGSGGAIVGTFEDAAHFARLEAALAAIGCTTFVPTVGTRDLESQNIEGNGKWRNS